MCECLSLADSGRTATFCFGESRVGPGFRGEHSRSFLCNSPFPVSAYYYQENGSLPVWLSRTYRLSIPDLAAEQTRLSSTLSQLGLLPASPWNVSLRVYRHKNPQARPLYLVSSPDCQVGVVSRIDQRYAVIETAPGLDLLIASMETYEPSKVLTIEGSTYQFGDFAIRVGIENSSEIKALLLQIEFNLPIYLTQGEPAIKEIKTLLDPMEVFALRTMQYEEKVDIDGETFSPKHTAIDLLVALNCIG